MMQSDSPWAAGRDVTRPASRRVQCTRTRGETPLSLAVAIVATAALSALTAILASVIGW